LGHVTMLVCSTIFLPYWLTFHTKAGIHWYSTAFLGAIVSYGVVVYKSFPVSACMLDPKLQCLHIVVIFATDAAPFFFFNVCERLDDQDLKGAAGP
jgi:hypothetical protein